MSSTIKINGNFFQLYDTATGDEIIRSNRANTTFSIDSSDVFSFFFDSPVKSQFPLGTEDVAYNFDFADLIDSRTGLAFTSVAALETYLSETLCGVLVGSDPLKEDKINKVSDFTVIDETTYPNTKAVVGLLSGLTAYFFYKTASAVVPAYYQMKTDPSGGALQTIVTAGVTTGQKLATFITNTGSPNITFLPSGVVRVNTHADKSVGTKDVQLYAVISKRILAGTETVIVTTGYSTLLPLGGASADYSVDGSIPTGVALLSTDLLLVDIYAYCPLGGSAPTITLGIEDNTAARLELPSGTLDVSGKEDKINKDASNGYAGLTLLKINFKNVLNTFTSFFTNSNTAARTYTFQNRDGVIADDTDLALKANQTDLLLARNVTDGLALSDLTTALAIGTTTGFWVAPCKGTITEIANVLLTAQTSGTIFTTDVNKNGSTILSTKLTIDNTEKTSRTAATPCVLSSSTFSKGDIFTFDRDQIGDGTAKGEQIYLTYYQTP